MNYIDKRPATIFCDIDGTLVTHSKPTDSQLPTHKLDLLENTIEKILEWDKLGHRIILTTGRKESLRKVTETQLAEVGIIYDQLIMGIGGGKRYLINDRKPNGTEDYAVAINLERNKGIKDIQI
tara:strand:- start:9303 stop:9674 length:372 start_codon:yes stop_codon:yes gene_type:complete